MVVVRFDLLEAMEEIANVNDVLHLAVGNVGSKLFFGTFAHMVAFRWR